jgi:hypothetical protein
MNVNAVLYLWIDRRMFIHFHEGSEISVSLMVEPRTSKKN